MVVDKNVNFENDQTALQMEKDKSYQDGLQAKQMEAEMRADQTVTVDNPVNKVGAGDLSDIFSAPEQSLAE